MKHVPQCPMAAFDKHSDAAKRVCDTYNLHRLALGNDAIGKWFAARLIDGTTDNVVYDNKHDAVIHQGHNEQYYGFIAIGPAGANVCDMEIYLATLRKMYDAGMRLTDPNDARGGREVIKRATRKDQFAQSLGVSTNLILPGRGM